MTLLQPSRALKILQHWLSASLTALSLAIGVRPSNAGAQAQKTPQPPAEKCVDYREPPREYVETHAGAWTVLVEKQLDADDPDLEKTALTRLEKRLADAVAALPESARERLKGMRIFLMYGSKADAGGRDQGLAYIAKVGPEFHNEMDPRWADGIVIYSAKNYTRITGFWSLKALVHEFSHAYQLGQWPEDQPDIRQAWENAMKHDLYQNVKDDKGKTVAKAYAATNHLEYFAELSCMYFVGCNYEPFNREALKAYDPVGYDMIEKMWGIKKAADR